MLSSHAENKPNLVLLPIDVSEHDLDLEVEYGAALQEGLQNRYTVFYGAAVEKELEKEYSKVDCDAETCNQNIAIAFNGELIADGAVKRIKGGYLLKLVVRNVLTSQVIETKTYPCRGCDSFSVINRLKTLGRGLSNSNNASSRGNQNTAKADVGGKAILIFDSQPTGASIIINGKAAGKTPYQNLNHQIGDNLVIELRHAIYKPYFLDIGLEQAITQLQPSVLEVGQGQVLITVQPFKADTLIYVDGQAKGAAPLNLTLTAGSHQIKAHHKGRDSESRTLNLMDGDSQTLSLALTSIIKDLGIKFVQIPAGSFQMGSNEADDEKPIHTVNVPAFKMMTTEVTKGQFAAFIKDSGYKTDAERNYAQADGCKTWQEEGWKYDWRKGTSWRQPDFKQSDKHPVVCVSHNDAMKFIAWLNQQTGQTYSLPSEAQWEYAAKADSFGKYPWGSDTSKQCQYANGADNTSSPGGRGWGEKAECNDGYWFTGPVASYKPNAFGLYDMHGNVWEWTQDCWNESYKGAPNNGSPWVKGDCDYSVVRGGSWDTDPTYLRSANRNRAGRADRNKNFGFRLIQGQ